MKTRSVCAAAAGLVLGLAAAQPGMAQEATPWQEVLLEHCDTNKDGVVTRQEYLDEMARRWDGRLTAMAKTDRSVAAGRLNKSQFTQFATWMFDPGQIGGN
jgi:hypothetical protein